MPPRKRATTAAPAPHADAPCATTFRTESFATFRPDGTEVTVTRCQDCGEQTVT